MSDVNLVEFARRFERRAAASVVALATDAAPLADGWMVFGGVGSYVNKSCGYGYGQEVTGAELDALVTFFSSRGVEPKAELSPFVPVALLQGLAERGFVLREFETVLYRPLRGDEASLSPVRGAPPGLTVERVDPSDDAAVRTFVEVSGSGFVPEGESMPEVFLSVGLKSARQPASDSFLARLDGVPVGAGGCESSEGLTTLYGTSVLPAYRRRGVQQALISARLARAVERGSDMAAIMSAPGIPTERNAMRMGFLMAYSRAVLVKHGAGLEPSP
ncbi:GNAT family N-acetyltransferase [Corallococcus praedator]|uniref:GNAT family N-acetyltransferase n=1 Tax=Corallococcus praedator TaxID=2316724 RepID=A0ABX9QAG6_9BACT|nr:MULTISPECIES: GNAT family N-acetyltransferase [Corallococcus]RKH09825.1 GNAT family N-acetyltransferase [Corallococcus sp. CA047B]RKH25146.1 GNAT family N-acetyltransferase [Corallococcus sp. CA031C]RKH98397.1 GNAT family N-acetyltransferase [Corallococcus praedator]